LKIRESRDNKQVNKGHSLLRTVCEWLRHSIANRAPQTAPITMGVSCTIKNMRLLIVILLILTHFPSVFAQPSEDELLYVLYSVTDLRKSAKVAFVSDARLADVSIHVQNTTLGADRVVYISSTSLGATKTIQIACSSFQTDRQIEIVRNPSDADVLIHLDSYSFGAAFKLAFSRTSLGANEVIYFSSTSLGADETICIR